MKDNWQYRLLALFMALICWYVVSGQEKVETWLEVPLDFVNLPQRMKIVSGAGKVQVRIRGTSSQIRAINMSRLAYKVDLADIRPGENIVPLLPENMSIVSAVDVVEISPSRLELVADTIVSRNFPVHLDWEGLPAEDMRFRNATLSPEQVTVTGFAHSLDGLKHVPTVHIRVPSDGGLSASGRARLMLPEGVTSEVTSVDYTLAFSPMTQAIWVKMNLEPVAHEGFTYTFDPKFVRVQLDVPVRLLRDKNWRETLRLFVDPGGEPSAGRSWIRPRAEFPEGVGILEMKPEDVEILVRRSEKSGG